MLAELKDLVQKGLFTQTEVKQIMKKRTAFETALVRRIAKKNDYLRYVAYEMGLEALRKKRLERLKLPKSAPSVSDYALVRRQFHIFERALKKFKSDVALWIQYIELAKKEGARSLVGRISARALQLHPNVPALYILAASHELSHLSPSAARTLLQRGIRLNSDSVEMWREYTRMELGFVESMRRRWGVLGIKVDDKGKGKAQQVMIVDEKTDGTMNEDEVDHVQTEADGEGDESEQARREIMQGAIVKSVVANAVKALPKPELFVALHELFSTYPTTPELRASLLDHLHSLLQQTLPTDPLAAKLSATRHLLPGLSGVPLVDALRTANEQLSSAVRDAWSHSHDSDAISSAYASFVEEWVQKPELDTSLKAYLLTSLHALITRLTPKQSSHSAPPPLLSTHLTLLAHHTSLHELLPYAKIIPTLGKKYTTYSPAHTSAKVWLARFELEKTLGLDEEERKGSRREARSIVHGEDVLDVWLWGVRDGGDEETRVSALKTLLNESMRMQDAPSFRIVHNGLLHHYLSTTPLKTLTDFRQLVTSCLPDSSTYAECFRSLTCSTSTSSNDDITANAVLKEVYETWKRLDVVTSSLEYASWLVSHGEGKEASEVVLRARAEVGMGERREALDGGWRAVLANMGGDELEVEKSDEGDVEMQE
ncbi:U3 small nucleolar RNA-associated protein 6-domain-containing protein [Irpex rosettiformis]|uniref:U3 small nucleolar RNA-associated protein 6-domain-containing protein n=1 Tax=Irpex rosettiformis TaxID=378272 RepID=A0ACB8UFQ0_9APHY|nr:U3 small nucleolar RNA-associated protein 6-domain-containing protein [Irpex rosettiformis]